MKGENIYKQDGKFYARDIRRIDFDCKRNETYILACTIKQRGYRDYYYQKGWDHLKLDDYPNSRRLYLSETASLKLEEAIRSIDEQINELKFSDLIRVEYPKKGLTCGYRHTTTTSYDYLVEAISEKRAETSLYTGSNQTLEKMLRTVGEFKFFTGTHDSRSAENKSIDQNPFYVAAEKAGDETLQLQLKLYYRVATASECAALAKIEGKTILPPLPEEYNKNYYVSGGINCRLLEDSGYLITHRPYFAMQGRTHRKWTLNPYEKYGVDAAPVEKEVITFEEFLALFRQSSD